MTHPSPLNSAELERRLADIEAELRVVATHRAGRNTIPRATALIAVYEKMFPDRHSARDRARFFVFAAPIMRRLTIELSRTGRANGTINLTAVELEQWLTRLESFDPECARMIDLRYFAGLTTRETASALDLSPQVVIRDLRFAKAWLQARVRWSSFGRKPE